MASYVLVIKGWVLYILFLLVFSVREVERLDWSERMRIIMGSAYCLQYMHHDLNPPIAHTKLSSNMIFLTDDFAAKVHISRWFFLSFIYVSHLVTHLSIPLSYQFAEVTFADIVSPPTKTTGGDSKKSDHSRVDLETNVYNFGVLLLEIISGKLPYSEEQGNLVNWVSLKQVSFGNLSSTSGLVICIFNK